MGTRYYKVTGTVCVDLEEVLDWLEMQGADLGEDPDEYEPTDNEWKGCALDLFENDEISWLESDLEPEKR